VPLRIREYLICVTCASPARTERRPASRLKRGKLDCSQLTRGAIYYFPVTGDRDRVTAPLLLPRRVLINLASPGAATLLITRAEITSPPVARGGGYGNEKGAGGGGGGGGAARGPAARHPFQLARTPGMIRLTL